MHLCCKNWIASKILKGKQFEVNYLKQLLVVTNNQCDLYYLYQKVGKMGLWSLMNEYYRRLQEKI